MPAFNTSDKNGRYIEYGWTPFVGYYIHVWNKNDIGKAIPSIVENRHTGLTGARLVEMFENECGVKLPSAHREEALSGLAFSERTTVWKRSACF